MNHDVWHVPGIINMIEKSFPVFPQQIMAIEIDSHGKTGYDFSASRLLWDDEL